MQMVCVQEGVAVAPAPSSLLLQPSSATATSPVLSATSPSITSLLKATSPSLLKPLAVQSPPAAKEVDTKAEEEVYTKVCWLLLFLIFICMSLV